MEGKENGAAGQSERMTMHFAQALRKVHSPRVELDEVLKMGSELDRLFEFLAMNDYYCYKRDVGY